MADFKGWALQYVLADEEGTRQDAVAKTSNAIKDAPARSTAILSWVQAIDPWMPAGLSQNEPPDDEEDEGGEPGVNIIARAKALDFLADTLSLLGKDLLRTDQVKLLVAFFGKLFSVDHKAGITAAAKALGRLVGMKGFKPEMADSIIRSVASMRDDFRLQPPSTRSEVYGLLQDLLADQLVASQLQHVYGSSGGLVLDLLQLCHHERDPKCLTQWFGLLRCIMKSFSLSADVEEEVFKSFSAYFPISMRSSVSPAGITVDDLKASVRSCFVASDGLARLSLPFLIQKLDQGDAVTMAVKVDILKTVRSCLEQYRHPSQSIAPFAAQIWNSLKYEVRNGEAQESIEGSLLVLGTISYRLSTIAWDPPAGKSEGRDPLTIFTAMVLDDCLEDLANPTYTKQAALLLRSVLEVHTMPFSIMVPRIMGTISSNLREPRSPEHARASLEFMTAILEVRSGLIEAATEVGARAGAEIRGVGEELHELDSQIQELFYTLYTRFWKENNKEVPDSDNISILKAAARGLAALVCQPGRNREAGGCAPSLLCDNWKCEQICAMISDRIVNIFQLSSCPDVGLRKELADVVVQALRGIVLVYAEGYSLMLRRALSTVRDRDWRSSCSPNSMAMLKTMLSRLSYIGCSGIPRAGDPMRHFHRFASSGMQLLFHFLDGNVPFEVSTVSLSAVYSGLLHFKDACISRDLYAFEGRRPSISTDWKSCVESFAGSHPDFANPGSSTSGADAPGGKITQGQGQGQGQAKAAHGPTDWPLSTDISRHYLECGLYLVVQLYRRATAKVDESSLSPSLKLSTDFDDDHINLAGKTTTATELQDAYLHQLADMATFVVRDLKEGEQLSLQLCIVTSTLFRLEIPQDTWLSTEDNGRTNILSLGILQGLRPAAMASIFESESVSRYILTDMLSAETFPERTQKVRDGIATVLANKWIGVKAVATTGPGGQQSQQSQWRNTVNSLNQHVQRPSSEGPALRMERYARIIAFAAGAVARRDRDVDSLVSSISYVPQTGGAYGEHMARCLEELVSPRAQLSLDNHAVVKPLYQQWVYVHFVQPRLGQSFPSVRNDAPDGVINAIAVIHMLRHMTFAIYEEDNSSIVRLLVAGVSSLENQSDVDAALQVLEEALANKPDALKDQMNAVIAGGVRTLKQGLGTSPEPRPHLQQPGRKPGSEKAEAETETEVRIPARFVKKGNPARCRRHALLLLKKLPETFEDRLLVQYSAQLSRVLADACGDPVREVRQAALAARRSWAKVG